MVPTFGLIDHVTAVFAFPVTVAVNCSVSEALRVDVDGETDTATDAGCVSVTVAVPVLVGSAWLVAVTVTICCIVINDGAVYKPLELMEPTFGLIDQVTAVFAFPVTVAVNCWVSDGPRVAVDGETETATDGDGMSVTVAVPVLVGSA
jgi:hypothetical protein